MQGTSIEPEKVTLVCNRKLAAFLQPPKEIAMRSGEATKRALLFPAFRLA
jgi:hypothetical protein